MRAKLKARMKERNVKPEELAPVINCKKDYIYKIIAGTRNPVIEDAKKIANFLEDTVDNLFFDNQLYDSSNEQAAAQEPA